MMNSTGNANGDGDGASPACAHAVARGRVQGVFYRDTVRRAAVDRGVSGSAVNEPDGSVSIVLEGPRTEVEAVIETARRGSAGARVDELLVEWREPAGLSGFRTG